MLMLISLSVVIRSISQTVSVSVELLTAIVINFASSFWIAATMLRTLDVLVGSLKTLYNSSVPVCLSVHLFLHVCLFISILFYSSHCNTYCSTSRSVFMHKCNVPTKTCIVIAINIKSA